MTDSALGPRLHPPPDRTRRAQTGSDLQTLLTRFPRAGRVAWIGVRPGKKMPLSALTEAHAIAGRGLDGDHYAAPKPTRGRRKRQVTLIQAEHLTVLGALLGEPPIDPERVRRNLVVAGLNLLALKDRRFRIGDALFETTGLAHPCSRMEAEFGAGGYNAMRGHGGITAAVVRSGTFRIGDDLTPIIEPEAPGLTPSAPS
jgi:MOSC domain-containing protein YiiM